MDASPPWELYERHADLWLDVRTADHVLEHSWLDRFLDLVQPAAGVLDLGCGHGQPIGARLLASGRDVWGVDRAPSPIETARSTLPDGHWLVADMAAFDLGRRFGGFVMWHSFFHLTADEQRQVFPLLGAHAESRATLLFTTGNEAGSVYGQFGGEALAHHSLDPAEYTALLAEEGFAVIDHVESDPTCGGATVWLAQREAPDSESPSYSTS